VSSAVDILARLDAIMRELVELRAAVVAGLPTPPASGSTRRVRSSGSVCSSELAVGCQGRSETRSVGCRRRRSLTPAATSKAQRATHSGSAAHPL
jgi:hypothetical protein